ncbi:hypothetical protein [Streptomyces sp. NPDC048521]|uniref:hypothetical protein n=1 Tax=Streptomyces sp. NPDC048521 TaxID=3365566 RepID=UPI00371FFF15
MGRVSYRQLFAKRLADLVAAAGHRTQAELAQRVSARKPLGTALSTSTLSAWLSGKAVPADPALDRKAAPSPELANPLSALLHELYDRTAQRRPTRQELAEWETLRRRAWDESHARRAAEPETTVGRPLGSLGGPWELSAYDVIRVSGRPGLPRMPDYVPRAHDEELARIAARTASGTSASLLLVGEPSTGKTRALWEALTSVPEVRADWTIWEPAKSGTHAQLMADLERVGPRTVVWLDDTRERLLLSTADAREDLARGLRRLVHDELRAPVLIVDTMWPDDYRALRTTSAGRHGTHARLLLEGHVVEVPATFRGAALRTMRRQARSDPRIDEAVRHARSTTPDRSEIAVTQYLGGVPRVLRLAQEASPGGKALLRSATHARLLGYGPALPERLLAEGAVAYLEDWEYEAEGEDFAAAALAYLSDRAECRGVRPPLGRVPRRPYEEGAAGPYYRLNDALEHRARSGRRTAVPVPAGMWRALLAHGEPHHLTAVGAAAERRGLRRLADRLYARAEASGDAEAAAHRGRLLEDIDPETALRCYRRALERGAHVFGFAVLPLLERLGRRRSEIARWSIPQLDLDGTASVAALAGAAGLARSLGLTRRAVELACRAASRGDDVTLPQQGGGWEMVEILLAAGHPDAAEVWARSCALIPDSGLFQAAVSVMVDNGHAEEALAWLQDIGDEAPPCASAARYRLLRRLERDDEAWSHLVSRAQSGDRGARGELERWGKESGRETPPERPGQEAVPEAAQEAVRKEAVPQVVHRKDLSSLWDGMAADRRVVQDMTDALYDRLKSCPDASKESLLASCEGWSGLLEVLVFNRLFDRACEDGDLGLALRLYGWEPHYTVQPWPGPASGCRRGSARSKAEVLIDTFGAAEEIVEVLLRAVEAGDGDGAEHRLVALLHRTGRSGEAERLSRYGIEPGATIAAPWRPVDDGSAAPVLSTR